MRATSREQAADARSRLRADMESAILPALGQVFDEATGQGEVLRLERLELRVRVSEFDRLVDALTDAVRREIKGHFSGRGGSATTALTPPASSVFGAKDDIALLLDYLRMGKVEWQSTDADPHQLQRSLRDLAIRGWREAIGQMADLQRQHTSAPAFLFRLLQLLPLSEWSRVPRESAVMLAAEDRETLAEIISALAAHPIASSFSSLWTAALLLAGGLVQDETGRRALARQLELATSGDWHPSESVRERVKKFIARGLPKSDPDPASAGHGEGVIPQEDPAAMVEEADPVNHNGSRALGDPIERGFRDVTVCAQRDRDRIGPLVAPPSVHADAKPAARSSTRDDAPFGTMAHHVGLILLHPFLPRFFESTGIVLETAGPPMIARAAHLLYVVATGREDIFEFEMTFIKVLLGRRPDDDCPIAAGVLTETDRKEVESLLQAAITHWPALKNTSVSGLRESFLQRQGVIREDEFGWQLHVESKPHDVLLDYLPWGIGFVKLPWMSRPITVDWSAR